MNAAVNGYFDWLMKKAQNEEGTIPVEDYSKMFWQLFNTEFSYTIPLDGNRAEDGVSLRYRYGDEYGIPESKIASEIDICPCSVLEMIVALAIRVEENIMYDSEIGNRTGLWIWTMLNNLGISDVKNDIYEEPIDTFIYNHVNVFLRREYDFDGNGGGLFVVTNSAKPLYDTEIWYQAMWYFKELLYKK